MTWKLPQPWGSTIWGRCSPPRPPLPHRLETFLKLGPRPSPPCPTHLWDLGVPLPGASQVAAEGEVRSSPPGTEVQPGMEAAHDGEGGPRWHHFLQRGQAVILHHRPAAAPHGAITVHSPGLASRLNPLAAPGGQCSSVFAELRPRVSRDWRLCS